jgi:ABC-type enterochelin transport system substrate-binding protein
MQRECYIARSIQHWETVLEITDSEEEAKAEAARLDSEAERAEQKPTHRRA